MEKRKGVRYRIGGIGKSQSFAPERSDGGDGTMPPRATTAHLRAIVSGGLRRGVRGASPRGQGGFAAGSGGFAAGSGGFAAGSDPVFGFQPKTGGRGWHDRSD